MDELKKDIIEIIGERTAEQLLHHRYGLSISSLIDQLRNMGWKNLGNFGDFMTDLEEMGFQINPLRRKNGSEIKGKYGVTL